MQPVLKPDVIREPFRMLELELRGKESLQRWDSHEGKVLFRVSLPQIGLRTRLGNFSGRFLWRKKPKRVALAKRPFNYVETMEDCIAGSWVSSVRSQDDNYDTCETIVIPISLEKIMTYII